MQLYLALDPFPEVPEMLRRLHASRLSTAILSNGSPRMLAAAVENAGLSNLFDHVPSVELVGVYKSHPKVYQLACDRLDVGAGEILFASSNAWDVHAASAFGMSTVWCNRYSQRGERLPGRLDRAIGSLIALPSLLARGRAHAG
jgi:2-haloacid dehalogenase